MILARRLTRHGHGHVAQLFAGAHQQLALRLRTAAPSRAAVVELNQLRERALLACTGDGKLAHALWLVFASLSRPWYSYCWARLVAVAAASPSTPAAAAARPATQRKKPLASPSTLVLHS